MTRFNFKDKLHQVRSFRDGPGVLTPVWLSEQALDGLLSLPEPLRGRFVAKMEHCSRAGFSVYRGSFVRPEPRSVVALGLRADLFRLYGFYDGRNFIGIDALSKKGQKLGVRELARIEEVARVRDQRDWRYSR